MREIVPTNLAIKMSKEMNSGSGLVTEPLSSSLLKDSCMDPNFIQGRSSVAVKTTIYLARPFRQCRPLFPAALRHRDLQTYLAGIISCLATDKLSSMVQIECPPVPSTSRMEVDAQQSDHCQVELSVVERLSLARGYLWLAYRVYR